MNFTSSIHPRSKGHTVWKRNANTSSTNRRPVTINPKKVRLTSQASDYSCFPDTENNLKINTTIPRPEKKYDEWNEVKSMAKHSTIASRMQLKKSIQLSFLQMTQKKGTKKDKSNKNSRNNTFSRVIDTNGNITKSFKQSNEFKSMNPYIPKDFDKMKKRTFNLYETQRKKMDSFFVQNSPDNMTMTTYKDEKIDSRAKSLLIDYNRTSQMQKISERQQQYESRMNSTRMKGNQNDIQQKQNINESKKAKQLEKQAWKYIQEQPVRNFTKSRQRSVYQQSSKKSTSGLSSTTTNQNLLLKGLLGQYANYQKLSKHQLIQKLISLQYLAQNIFKKNKHLEQQLEKKDIRFRQTQHVSSQSTTDKDFSKNRLDNQNKIMDRSSSQNRNMFVIDNADGYFNEFLQSQKGKAKQLLGDFHQQEPQRFREDQ